VHTRRSGAMTYDDLHQRGERNRFEELIDGHLLVADSPTADHQRTVKRLLLALERSLEGSGREVVVGPMDVLVDDTNVLQPDLLVIPADRAGRWQRPVDFPPDLVVEVLSPSNRAHDLVRKRAIYERFGAPELWFVDLEAGRVEQVVMGANGAYGASRMHAPGQPLVSDQLDGATVQVLDILGY